MKLREYFNGISPDEITKRLLYLDKTIMDMHHLKLYDKQNGVERDGIFYVGDLGDIEIIDGKITPESLYNRWNYLDSGYDDRNKAINKNILEVCSIGLCAYNNITILHLDKNFIKNVILDRLDELLKNSGIPPFLHEYYIDVFYRGKVDYLNNFVMEYNEMNNASKGNQKVLVKTTKAVENYLQEESDFNRSISNNDAAYTKILLLPALLILVVLVFLVVYFIVFR